MTNSQPKKPTKGVQKINANPQNSDYEMRLSAALEELDSRGVWKRNSRPPYFLIARKLGLQIKPPYYASIAFNATFGCVLFAILWSLIMWIAVWSRTDILLKDAFASTLNAALVVGLLTSLTTYLSVRFHKLTPWDNLLEGRT